MRQSLILGSILAAASSVLAAPMAQSAPYTNGTLDQSVAVLLDGKVDVKFSVIRNRISTGAENRSPVSTVEIKVGADALKQDIRCQVLDAAGIPIAATRTPNFDISFSDSKKGIWTFDPPAMIDVILCDPNLVGKGSDVNVTLGGNGGDSLNTLVNVVKSTSQTPVASGPFNTFLLNVGVNSNPALRCQIHDVHGMPIFGTRGENRGTL